MFREGGEFRCPPHGLSLPAPGKEGRRGRRRGFSPNLAGRSASTRGSRARASHSSAGPTPPPSRHKLLSERDREVSPKSRPPPLPPRPRSVPPTAAAPTSDRRAGAVPEAAATACPKSFPATHRSRGKRGASLATASWAEPGGGNGSNSSAGPPRTRRVESGAGGGGRREERVVGRPPRRTRPCWRLRSQPPPLRRPSAPSATAAASFSSQRRVRVSLCGEAPPRPPPLPSKGTGRTIPPLRGGEARSRYSPYPSISIRRPQLLPSCLLLPKPQQSPLGVMRHILRSWAAWRNKDINVSSSPPP